MSNLWPKFCQFISSIRTSSWKCHFIFYHFLDVHLVFIIISHIMRQWIITQYYSRHFCLRIEGVDEWCNNELLQMSSLFSGWVEGFDMKLCWVEGFDIGQWPLAFVYIVHLVVLKFVNPEFDLHCFVLQWNFCSFVGVFVWVDGVADLATPSTPTNTPTKPHISYACFSSRDCRFFASELL